MHKAIYLNVHTHVHSTKNRPLDSQLAMNEVDRLIREGAHNANTRLSLDVKRVRLENRVGDDGVDVGILIYLEAEQEAASNFTNFASSELEKILTNTFKAPTPSGLSVTLHKIEENTNAVDELSDETETFEN